MAGSPPARLLPARAIAVEAAQGGGPSAAVGAAREGGARAGPTQVVDGAPAVARGITAVPSPVVLPILPGVRPVFPKSLPRLLGILLQAVPSVLCLLRLQEVPDLEAAVIATRKAAPATADDDRREVAVR